MIILATYAWISRDQSSRRLPHELVVSAIETDTFLESVVAVAFLLLLLVSIDYSL